MKKTWNKFKEDPFLRVTLSWALGLTGMLMVLSWAQLQFSPQSFDRAIFEIVPYLLVLFGAGYMVKFVGRRPVFYTTLCGIFVAFSMALLGLFGDLLNGLSFQALIRFIWVGAFRSIGMGLAGTLGGWLLTRGRVPIEIEMPDKKEIEAAKREGREEPTPRIITPISAMPGSAATNIAMLDQLDNDPVSLLPEKEKRRRIKPDITKKLDR